MSTEDNSHDNGSDDENIGDGNAEEQSGLNNPTEPNSDGGGLNNESVQRMIDDAVKPLQKGQEALQEVQEALQEGQEVADQKIGSLTDNMGSLQGQMNNMVTRQKFKATDDRALMNAIRERETEVGRVAHDNFNHEDWLNVHQRMGGTVFTVERCRDRYLTSPDLNPSLTKVQLLSKLTEDELLKINARNGNRWAAIVQLAKTLLQVNLATKNVRNWATKFQRKVKAAVSQLDLRDAASLPQLNRILDIDFLKDDMIKLLIVSGVAVPEKAFSETDAVVKKAAECLLKPAEEITLNPLSSPCVSEFTSYISPGPKGGSTQPTASMTSSEHSELSSKESCPSRALFSTGPRAETSSGQVGSQVQVNESQLAASTLLPAELAHAQTQACAASARACATNTQASHNEFGLFGTVYSPETACVSETGYLYLQTIPACELGYRYEPPETLESSRLEPVKEASAGVKVNGHNPPAKNVTMQAQEHLEIETKLKTAELGSSRLEPVKEASAQEYDLENEPLEILTLVRSPNVKDEIDEIEAVLKKKRNERDLVTTKLDRRKLLFREEKKLMAILVTLKKRKVKAAGADVGKKQSRPALANIGNRKQEKRASTKKTSAKQPAKARSSRKTVCWDGVVR